MSGISISNHGIRRSPAVHGALILPVLFGLLALLSARADLVDFGGGERLSGHIKAIDAKGRVTLQSELSKAPLVVRPEAVRSIRLDPSINDKLKVPDQEVQLINGDAIPCRVKSMDAEKIEVSTWFAGTLEIPRVYVSALHFGISKPKPILSAAQAVKGWSDSDSWKIDPETFSIISKNVGRISRKLDSPLPEQYIIRFNYTWKRMPNLRFYFAADRLEEGPNNRYILSVNNSGFEVKRQSAKGRIYTTLSLSPRHPTEAWPEGMDIELRIDRSLAEPLFLLFINGELIDRFSDAMKNPPSGPKMMLESSAGRGASNKIRNFEILEWSGDSSDRRKRGETEPGKDTVFDRQGEHFSGKAVDISNFEGRPVILFRHPHAKEPLRIPLDKAASLWFSKPENPEEIGPSRLVFGLVDNGLLHVSSCTMDERRAECVHPLLGKLSIKRRAVSTIKRTKKSEK